MWLLSKELIKFNTNLNCSPEQAGELSQGLSSTSKLFVPWKLKDTHAGYSCSDKMTVASILSRYGRTLEVSRKETTTAANSSNNYSASMIAWLFPGDSHARIYQWLEKAKALTANAAAYGENSQGWFAKYDPQQSMWKTAQCSLLGDLTEYSQTFPKWGIMLHGVCWPLRTLEPTIKGKGYGYMPGAMIPTPTKSDATDGSIISEADTYIETKNGTLRKINRNGTNGSIGLGRMVQNWPTPTVSDCYTDKLKSTQQKPGSLHSVTLSQKVKWPTPSQSDGTRGGVMTENMTGQSLVQMVNTVTKQVFPTPRVSGEESYETVSKRKGHEAAIQHNLLAAVQFFPTPCAQDHGGSTRSDFSPKLSEVAKMYPTPAAQDGKNSTLPVSLRNRGSIPGQLLKDGVQPGAQLNPDWVELLMMWPLHWTSLEPNNNSLEAWASFYNLESHQTTEWEQGIPRVATNIPNRTKRIEAIGNGQVPRCYAAAYVILSEILSTKTTELQQSRA